MTPPQFRMLRDILLKGADLGSWHWNLSSGVVQYDTRWAAMLGFAADEIEPHLQAWESRIHPEDHARTMAMLRDHLDGLVDQFDCEHRLRHRDGSWVWVLGRGKVIHRDGAGCPLEAIGTALDISAQRRAEEQLRRSEAHFRSFINHSSSYMFAKDPEGRYILANAAYLRLFGYGAEDELLGRTDAERFGRDVDWTANDRQVLWTGEPLEVEEVAEFPDGQRTYISAKFPLRDEDGRIVAIGGISTDITARKRADAARALLMREVDHRAKNALAAVQALVMLTDGDSVEDFRERLLGRIQAMGRAHTLLAANRWNGGDLGLLVREELAAWGDQVNADGPPQELDTELVQPLALALHELATNAAKYGALSSTSGTVRVGWAVQDGHIRIDWHEQGGPPVTAPVRRGTGTELLILGIQGQAGGSVAFDWTATGLRCRITLPCRPPLS